MTPGMMLKVCGVNDPAFAVAAEAAGVDYLGFIFHQKSPRNVTPEQARTIVRGLSGRARRVGVFVSQTAAEIAAVCRAAGLQVVQLHRRAAEADVAALRAAGFEVWTLAGGAVGDGLLFDPSHGDGETAFRKGPYKAILAGRIGVDNLAEALACAPDILDVNSSLESAPGRKSVGKLRDFLAALRRFGNSILPDFAVCGIISAGFGWIAAV